MTVRAIIGFAEEDNVLTLERAGDAEPPEPEHLDACGRDLPAELVERLMAARAVWVAAQNDVRTHVGLPTIKDGWFE